MRLAATPSFDDQQLVADIRVLGLHSIQPVFRVSRPCSATALTFNDENDLVQEKLIEAPGIEPAPYRPGDRQDFDRLYRTTYQRIFRTLVAILGDPAAAEDCTQDAFLQAFKGWARWKQDAPAEAWLHRIAINTAISHRRKMRLREVGELVRRLGRPVEPDPQENAIEGEVMQELRRLPPKQAAAIVLRHLHGYSNREIGAALGIPESTIASRLMEAKRTLRRRLGASASAVSDTSGPLHVPPYE